MGVKKTARVKQKLTKTYCQTASYAGKGDKGLDIRWDTEVKGFGLRLSKGGTKQFVLNYRWNGKPVTYSLGQFGEVTVDQARRKALEALGELAKGIDPRESKKKKSEDSTVEELSWYFYENHSKLHKKSHWEDKRRIEQRIIPTFGKIKANELSITKVRELHLRIGCNHPTEANRVIVLLQTIYNYAILSELLPPHHQNPVNGITKFKEIKRDTWCPPEKIPTLIAAIKSYPNIIIRDYLLFLLFTGLRRREAACLKWEHVDLSKQEIVIPETKAGRKHYLSLNELAAEILKTISRQKGNPYVFWANSKSGHIEEPKTAWKKIKEQAGIPDMRIHDLRRTHGSILATQGVSLAIIGKILNHSTPSTTAIYARLSEDPIKAAEKVFGKEISKLLDQEKE